MAQNNTGAIDESEFAEWRRQQLNESRLSEEEFMDLARRRLLSIRLQEFLAARIPTVADQVHLYAITQETIDDATKVKTRLDAGEDFFRLARELNVDEDLKAKGGDLGWYPRNALAPALAGLAFDRLEVGQAGKPVRFGEQRVAIFLVSERAVRQVDGDTLEAMHNGVLDEWFGAEFEKHKVEYHGFDNGYDSSTDAWVRRQVEAMNGQGAAP